MSESDFDEIKTDCYINVTDRQTTDGRATAYNNRVIKFRSSVAVLMFRTCTGFPVSIGFRYQFFVHTKPSTLSGQLFYRRLRQ